MPRAIPGSGRVTISVTVGLAAALAALAAEDDGAADPVGVLAGEGIVAVVLGWGMRDRAVYTGARALASRAAPRTL